MEPVSRIRNNGIESDYFNVGYSLNSNNVNLVLALAKADINPTKETAENLLTEFYTNLVACESKHQLDSFRELVEKLEEIGGIAKDFFGLTKQLITENGIKHASEMLAKKAQEQKKEFSYFEVQHSLNAQQAVLVTALTNANKQRNSETIDNLNRVFLENVTSCKTKEDRKDLMELMQKLAQMGGYAKEFFEDYKDMIQVEEEPKLEGTTLK